MSTDICNYRFSTIKFYDIRECGFDGWNEQTMVSVLYLYVFMSDVDGKCVLTISSKCASNAFAL